MGRCAGAARQQREQAEHAARSLPVRSAVRSSAVRSPVPTSTSSPQTAPRSPAHERWKEEIEPRLVALMEEERQLIKTQSEMFGAAAELASAEARVLSARLATAEDQLDALMALDRDFRAELGAHREAQHEASMSSLRAELEAARIRMDEQEGEMGKMSQWMASEIAKHKARLDLEIEALADTASQLGSSEAVALAHAMGSDERLNLQQRGVGAAQSPSRRTSPLGAVTVTGRGVDADAPWNTREGSACRYVTGSRGFLAAVVPSLAGDVTTAAKDPPRAGDVTAADDDGGGVRRRSFATREEAVSYRRRGKPSTYSYSDTKQEGGEAAEEVAHESHGGGGGSSSSSNSGIGSASAAQDAQDEVSRLRTQLAVMEDQMRARLANAAEAAMQECDTRRRDAEAAERWSRQLEEKLDRTSAALDIEREESRRLEAEIAHLHERLSAAEQVMVVAGTPASARHVSPQSGVTPGF